MPSRFLLCLVFLAAFGAKPAKAETATTVWVLQNGTSHVSWPCNPDRLPRTPIGG